MVFNMTLIYFVGLCFAFSVRPSQNLAHAVFGRDGTFPRLLCFHFFPPGGPKSYKPKKIMAITTAQCASPDIPTKIKGYIN